MNTYKVEAYLSDSTTILDLRFNDADTAIVEFLKVSEGLERGQGASVRMLDVTGVWIEPNWNMETTIEA